MTLGASLFEPASAVLLRGCRRRRADSPTRQYASGLCIVASASGHSALLPGSGRFKKHVPLANIFCRKLGIAADFQRRRPASWVVAAEHTGVNQEHLVAEPWPDAPALLRGVSRNNVRNMVGIQQLPNFCGTFVIAPVIVAAEPQWTVLAHAEPVAKS